MNTKKARRGRMSESGFTIVELLVYLIISVVIVAGVYNLLIGQQRLYLKQRELQDVRGSLRAAANLLAFELRQAYASGGDLYEIETYEVRLRSLQGGGVVCGKHLTQPRLGLLKLWGEFGDSEADSAFLYAMGEPVGEDMDGAVVEEIFDPAFARRPMTRIPTHETGERAPATPLPSPEDEEYLELLRSLGYVQ